MNASRFATGSVIFTDSEVYARRFAKETDGGMVGVNVPSTGFTGKAFPA